MCYDVIMKTTLLLFLLITLVSCNKTLNRESTTQGDQEVLPLVHRSWHVTEGLASDPVSLPSCSMDRVRKLKIGDSLDSVQGIVGIQPFPFIIRRISQYYTRRIHLTQSTIGRWLCSTGTGS